MKTLLDKIKEAKLVGRGGAEFPTATKWEATKNAKGSPKYVICNASEGEPGVYKDFYILQNFPEEVVKGMVLAMDYLKTDICWFNINEKYYNKLIRKLNPIIKKYESDGYKFNFYKEKPSYIGGEESAILNAIEGKRTEPRIKPPFPVEIGLFGKPTLIQNVETLFNIAKVSEDNYEPKRFYTVCGKVKKPGVYFLPDHLTAEKLLELTGNTPNFDYFGQIGGGASGMIVNKEQAKTHPVNGAGSLEIYPTDTEPRKMLLKWFKFYAEESCGKCTPCREGSYQLFELIKKSKKEIPWEKIEEIVEAMGKTSFCALGKSVMIPVHSYKLNVLKIK